MEMLTRIWTDFIIPHWLDVIVIMAFVMVTIYMVRKGKLPQLKSLAVLAITRVEDWYKSQEGTVKMKEAIKWVRSQSLLISWFFSEDKIEAIIQEEFYKLKQKLLSKALDKEDVATITTGEE